ncbi:hypothetical protein IM697_06985 [Streptomyces ferrugineus]|uniref:Uncharacterized protein n=1 Tax=Streptomyces ferrugineus TaxID=1413221 RepID=A0A7M2SPF2_9ACTN|nr:hypothetical protein [Streptomyces ferrugineus]QOV38132.1 hypothetical protein IM697_06985 [Streptomyces ferrugineus]
MRRICVDAAACFSRTVEPDTWVRLGVIVPVGREPEADAALARCQLCDIAARVADLDITRYLDDGGVWFESITCSDEDACFARQTIYRRIPPQPPR